MRGFIKTIRIIAFFVLLAFVLTAVAYPLIRPGAPYIFKNVQGFYGQKAGTLDAVYIGSSRVYDFWNPMLAYARNGMAVYNLSTAGQPIEAARYLVEEAHKTQPDAVMIVNLDPVQEYSKAAWQRVADGMKFSFTKVRFVWEMEEKGDEPMRDRFRYMFPLFRYHSRWQELDKDDFLYGEDRYKSASRHSTYLGDYVDVAAAYSPNTGNATEPAEATKKTLDDLLAYCAEENIKLLFTLAPQTGVDEKEMQTRAGMRDYLIGKGATVLDFQNDVDEIGLDLSRDYYNERHTNIHGSFKFTAYLADELNKRYGFTDKRGAKGYESWDAALADYRELTGPYVFPFEWQPENRADLDAVDCAVQSNGETGVTVSWKPVAGADGYTVYRKRGEEEPWEALADGGTECCVLDKEGKTGYYYAVASYTEAEGVRYYGKMNCRGVVAE